MADTPLVTPERNLRELTLKALILGAILSAVLAAANAYIGLLVGLTVSASIPAAAASMGILRLFRRSTILENNMVQTAASAGESLAAGIIFTLPALVIMGAWDGYHWGTMALIGVLGGILGVAFTIPLRRALIVETQLAFPEGVATAQVLKTGGIETDKDHPEYRHDEEAQRSFRVLLSAAGLGGLIKLLESGVGLLAGGVAATRSWLGGNWLFTGNITLSPALLGVGYIVGRNIASLVFIGGAIGTLIGVPLNWLLNREELMGIAGVSGAMENWSGQDWQNLANTSWQQCRRIGVGAMMVGGVWSLFTLARPLAVGVRASLHAHRQSKTHGTTALRTEQDTPIPYVGLLVLLSSVPLYFIFLHALDGYPERAWIAAIMSALMLLLGFVFASVAGYMAGLVGSSNNPISGVTIATVIVSALILLQLMGNQGMGAKLGPIAVMYLAGMICSAAAIAGDNMQDLKCGHIVGATPWRQQLFQMVGVVAAAGAIPLVLSILDQGYGIGRVSPLNPGATPLSAPQANLMRDLSTGIFGAGIEWAYIFIGFGLAAILIVLDQVQKNRGSDFRFPVLAVAVGVYLPLGLSVPIFLGGLLAHWQRKHRAGDSEGNGLLLASGLITGEALMGVLVAVLAVTLPGQVPFLKELAISPWLGLAGLAVCFWYLLKKG